MRRELSGFYVSWQLQYFRYDGHHDKDISILALSEHKDRCCQVSFRPVLIGFQGLQDHFDAVNIRIFAR